MIATINLPGSQYFDWFHGRKKDCELWLEEKAEECKQNHGGNWYSVYNPGKIVADKIALGWRYRDGSRVINTESNRF